MPSWSPWTPGIAGSIRCPAAPNANLVRESRSDAGRSEVVAGSSGPVCMAADQACNDLHDVAMPGREWMQPVKALPVANLAARCSSFWLIVGLEALKDWLIALHCADCRMCVGRIHLPFSS